MISYLWPILLVVASNTLYHICTKSAPSGMNPFAGLTVTYAISTLVSAVMCLATSSQGGYMSIEQDGR